MLSVPVSRRPEGAAVVAHSAKGQSSRVTLGLESREGEAVTEFVLRVWTAGLLRGSMW